MVTVRVESFSAPGIQTTGEQKHNINITSVCFNQLNKSHRLWYCSTFLFHSLLHFFIFSPVFLYNFFFFFFQLQAISFRDLGSFFPFFHQRAPENVLQFFLVILQNNFLYLLHFRIEKKRTIIPTLVTALQGKKSSDINLDYFYKLLFTRDNLKLVHIVCHKKGAHDLTCDSRQVYRQVKRK